MSLFKVLCITLVSCRCQTSAPTLPPSPHAAAAQAFALEAQEVTADLRRFTAAPHPFGSPAQKELGQWLRQKLSAWDFSPEAQLVIEAVPDPASSGSLSKEGQNVLVRVPLTAKPTCHVILASHYDTKDLVGGRYVGANDSASSSVLLLHLLRFLQQQKSSLPNMQCDVLGIWFDGEEAVLPNWDDGLLHTSGIVDNTYGSRTFVRELVPCGNRMCFSGIPIAGMVLLDMVGSPNLQLAHDTFSSGKLRKLLHEGAAALQLNDALSTHPQGIADDHLPFLKAGIPAINLIDFKHLEHWHQPSDTLANIDLGSMQKAGRLALYIALAAGTK